MSASTQIADKTIAGIPWSGLGVRPIFNQRYMTGYLVPAFQRARQAIDSIQLAQLSPQKSLSDFATAFRSAKKVEGAVNSAVNSGSEDVSALQAFRMTAEEYRGFVSQMWYSASYAAAMHTTGAIHGMISDGRLSEQEAMAHADEAVRTLNALAFLSQSGQLDQLRPGATGEIATTTVIIIAIVAVVAIAVIAGMIAWGRAMSERNAMLEKMCRQSSNNEQFRICADAMSEGPGSLDLSSAIDSTMTKVVSGAVLLSMLYAAPTIVRRFKKK